MKFRHTCILVKDLKKSLYFYVNLLGFTVVKKLHLKGKIGGKYVEKLFGLPQKGLADITYVKLRSDLDILHFPTLELHYWKAPKDFVDYTIYSGAKYYHFALTVKDLKRFYKVFKKRIYFNSPPMKAPDSNCLVCFIQDPDGNLIELVEDK